MLVPPVRRPLTVNADLLPSDKLARSSPQASARPPYPDNASDRRRRARPSTSLQTSPISCSPRPSPRRPVMPLPSYLDLEHEAFLDPKNDISLRSADGVVFGYRRLWLEAASPVFEDMFAPDREGPRKTEPSGRDVVDLAEWAAHLAIFLRLAHPHSEKPVIKDVEEIESLCAIADKYQARGIVLALLWQAQHSDSIWPPSTLALSILYEHVPTAIAALKKFGDPGGGARNQRLVYSLNDMSLDLLKLVRHTNAFLYLLKYQLMLVDPVYDTVTDWSGAIDTLTRHEDFFTLDERAVDELIEDISP